MHSALSAASSMQDSSLLFEFCSPKLCDERIILFEISPASCFSSSFSSSSEHILRLGSLSNEIYRIWSLLLFSDTIASASSPNFGNGELCSEQAEALEEDKMAY